MVYWACKKLRQVKAEAAVENNDGGESDMELLQRKYVLAITVSKYMAIMSLEYVAIGIAVLAAVVFRDSKVVVGFGSIRPGDAATMLVLQFVPEFCADFFGLALLQYYGISCVKLYWNVQADKIVSIARLLIFWCFLCFVI